MLNENIINQNKQTTKNQMAVFYLIDVSDDKKTKLVNAEMEKAIQCYRDRINKDLHNEVDIKIAIMQYSNGCSWITPNGVPISISDFTWKNLKVSKNRDLGSAFMELNSVLNNNVLPNELLQHSTIILVNFGEPTDNWVMLWEKLKNNTAFKNATKLAFCDNFKDVVNKEILKSFTGSENLIWGVEAISYYSTIVKETYQIDYRCNFYANDLSPIAAMTEVLLWKQHKRLL